MPHDRIDAVLRAALAELDAAGRRKGAETVITVEIGQLAIAALLLPLLWKLRRGPSYVPKYAPACSLLIMLAGVWWLLERTIFN